MNPEHQAAIRRAVEALAALPDYCGCAVVLVSDKFRNVQVSKHGLREDLVDQALASALEIRHVRSSRNRIIVPAEAGLPPRGKINGSG